MAARSIQSQPLMRAARALLIFLATLSSAAALAQTEAGSEVAPEPVEVAPAAPPATVPPSQPPDEAAPTTAPTTSPVLDKPGPIEAAPAPLPATTGKPPSPALAAPRKGPPSGRETPRSARALTIVNGRAVPATGVAVLVGAKVLTRSGPLAPNARVTLKLPNLKGCRVSVLASFSGWYSAVRSGTVNVCKAGQALVRL